MIARCHRCRTRYAAADRPAGEGRCPSCGALRLRADRRCAIADRLGIDAPCPHGGCHLARALGAPLLGDAGDPCPAERLALAQPENPLVLTALDDLRRELEGAGATHALLVRAAPPRRRRVHRPPR